MPRHPCNKHLGCSLECKQQVDMPCGAPGCLATVLVILLGLTTSCVGDEGGWTSNRLGVAASRCLKNMTSHDDHSLGFASQGWPGDYPNNTECIHVLEAPLGHQIRLEFRDEFHIEDDKSECAFDFLEMRDGPYGYSPLIGKYCGKEPPRLIMTKTRFIWIRFKSDDSIQYFGFRAVYDFIRPTTTDAMNNTVCQIKVDVSAQEGFINISQIHPSFIEESNRTEGPLDCTWVVRMRPIQKMWFRWVDYSMTTPNECSDSFIKIYETSTKDSDMSKAFCGDVAKDVKTDSNVLFIHFHIAEPSLMPKFNLHYTLFTSGACSANEFPCGDGSCIDSTLVCNGNRNCYSGSDETVDSSCARTTQAVSTTPGSRPMLYHSAILGIVGGIILTVITLGVSITCWQKHKEESRHQLALQQDDRRIIEVEMTNLLNQTPKTRRNSLDLPPITTVNHVGGANAYPTNNIPPSSTFPALAANHMGNDHKAQKANLFYPDIHACGRLVTDNAGDLGTYRRYLDVSSYREDETSAGTPYHDTTRPVVAVEKPPLPRRQSLERKRSRERSPKSVRDRTPSPRPDVVQEAKYVYARAVPLPNGQNSRRRYSDDSVLADKSDIWKPMGPDLAEFASTPRLDSNKRDGSFKKQRPMQTTLSAPGINQMVDIQDSPTPFKTIPSTSAAHKSSFQAAAADSTPRTAYANRKATIVHADDADSETYVPGRYPYSPPRDEPYRPADVSGEQAVYSTVPYDAERTPHTTPTHRARKSPKSQKRSAAESPKVPKRVSSKAPEIFYTRPNLNQPPRGVQRFHQV